MDDCWSPFCIGEVSLFFATTFLAIYGTIAFLSCIVGSILAASMNDSREQRGAGPEDDPRAPADVGAPGAAGDGQNRLELGPAGHAHEPWQDPQQDQEEWFDDEYDFTEDESPTETEEDETEAVTVTIGRTSEMSKRARSKLRTKLTVGFAKDGTLRLQALAEAQQDYFSELERDTTESAAVTVAAADSSSQTSSGPKDHTPAPATPTPDEDAVDVLV